MPLTNLARYAFIRLSLELAAIGVVATIVLIALEHLARLN